MNKTLNLITLFIMFFLSHSLFAQKDEFKYYISGSDQKLQILNQEGKPITNESFSYVGSFSEGLFPVEKNEKYGYLNKKGKLVIPYKYDFANEMYKGVAIIKINGKYGLIDNKGNYKISPQLEDVYFDNLKIGIITFIKDGLVGLMDKNGKILVPSKYETIGKIENGFAPAKINGKYGLIDTKGSTIIPFRYNYLGGFTNGISSSFIENENAKMGLLDIKGNILLNPEYDFVYTSQDNMVYLKKDNKKGLADKYGNNLLPTEYREDYHQFNEGLMIVEKDKKFGFVNDKGEMVIPLIYDGADEFSEGLAPVLKDWKWGFINIRGDTIIDFKFVGVMMPFRDGYASYGKRNFSSGGHYTTDMWGLIDKKGNIIVSNKYNSASPGYNGNFIVEKDEKKILINEREEVITLLKYEQGLVEMSGN